MYLTKAIFVTSILTGRMVDGFMLKAPVFQAAVDNVFIGIYPSPFNNMTPHVK
jgi:hypothetical protein